MTAGDALLSKLAEGVAHGEYSLLLGAGVSIGARGGNGKPLPGASDLRDSLINEFDIDTQGEDLSLARAYDVAFRRSNLRVAEFLADWFTGCSPSWQGLLGEFNWHRVWTLNIDDLIENAFRARGRPFRSFGWRERFSDNRVAHTEQVVHLHGRAEDLRTGDTRDDALVFSLSEYAAKVADPRSWHRIFFDEFAERPFIVIGARLSDEFDLISALRQGTTAQDQTGYPSVAILPTITQLQEEDLRSYGLEVVRSDGATFIRRLQDEHAAAIDRLRGVYGRAVSRDAALFLQQFTDLRALPPSTIDSSRKFYQGFRPTWDVIQGDHDAELSVTVRAANDVCQAVTDNDVSQRVHMMHGEAGTGKSTALLRIAKRLIGVGARPFLFRDDAVFDIDATLSWLQRVPRTVLLFDDCADFSGSIEELAELATSENVKFLAVVTDRTSRMRIVKDRIGSSFLPSDCEYSCGRLSDEDIDTLIDKLHSRGRLGRITRLSRDRQVSFFKEIARRRLFDAMADLEGGEGFKSTVRRGYDGIAEGRMQLLYGVAGLAYQFGVPLPTGIAASISGIPVRDLQRLMLDRASDALLLTAGGVRPPHRVTASIVAHDILSRDDRFSLSLLLIKALAPHLDIQAIRDVTRPYRLARILMDQDTVVNHVGHERARQWFAELREDFGWNGRYWEQRALLESRLGDHRTARSYAERSLRIHPHPFAFNTLGTILLRMACETGDAEMLQNGIKQLEQARDSRDWAIEHPYVTFFSSMLRYARDWGLPSVPENVRGNWATWYRHALRAALFSHEERFAQLEGWQRDWLMLATIRDA